MSTANNELYEKLKTVDFVEVVDKNKVKIGDEELRDIGVMVFI